MAPNVSYHCECSLGVVEQGKADSVPESASSQASTSTLPLLPSQYSPARYSFHSLQTLYYCTECLETRCQLCSQSEIVTHYCPACLFDVPSATVKAERNRCARNCFLCPVEGCGHLLTVTGTDPKDYGRMEAPEASVGVAPWFLSCQACKWDSKRAFRGGGGYVFEKSTGINAQVEAQRGPFPGQVEMDKLRSFYDSHLRKQNLSGARAASITGRSTTSLSKSKLLRDLPGLENSKYISGSRRAAALGLDKASASATRSENLPPYTSDLSTVSAEAFSKREEDRKKFTGELSSEQVGVASGIEDRWSSGWDQGPRSNHLVPQRVPLQTLSTLRCPGCRHILVKPDLKKSGFRFKIALQASLHLPEVCAHFKGVKVRSGRQSSSLNLREAEGRTRPQSMFLSAPEGGSSLRAGITKDEPSAEDSERLRTGKVYDYELTIANPDFNPIAVQIAVVQPMEASLNTHDTLKAGVDEAEAKKPIWTVQPSATRFSVKASDDMDVIDADLFGDLGLADEDDDLEEEAEEGSGPVGGTRRGKKGLGAGVLRKEGNRTVIALRLEVGVHAAEAAKSEREVEFALKVTFTSRQDPSESAASSKASVAEPSTGAGSGQNTRTRSFWTCVRLGMIEGRRKAPLAGSEPMTVTGETRQTAAESVTGINVELVGEEDRERSARLKKRRSELNLGST
ncbi:hypothetical protein BCV69DRAFT_309521 [Microstroma glucosiphilum]|uniref:Dynactin subunit 4 n=1 Tax=Pseudomicrostroma glucosiphilum TaxID=1684307 RepID=A0A316UEJ7_9BASI|nr:hypothetical protein BCV69DRAFT_309521 [Pseudomicrostroma glucosiphilum]PWN23640.1 hypothetical protein BCV69DRAFT_309521 [Pseudomicrostroma glucosiphilum]